MEKIKYKWIYGKGESFEEVRSVRYAVFVREQGYSIEGEIDEQDADAYHIIGYKAEVPVCTARLFTDREETYHIGRVAVLPQLRGKGVGLQMMEQVVQKAKEVGASVLFLDAQADKTIFYERVGFACTGRTMLDEGQPHAEMCKSLGKC